MSGIRNLSQLLKDMQPKLNSGDYIFCSLPSLDNIQLSDIIAFVNEAEGSTVVLEKEKADSLGLAYKSIFAWITLSVHSDLEAVGLTAAFSDQLAKANISCNVLAGYYHDHIFVAKNDAAKAILALEELQKMHTGTP